MHRSAAREDHIAYSLSAEAEEPNLFTMHALRLRHEREDAAGTALLDAPPETAPTASPAHTLTLVHGDEPAGRESDERTTCPPSASAILRDGWPWVEETAEAVDILLQGMDPATLLIASGNAATVREHQADDSPFFSADDRSVTQDILLAEHTPGGDMEDDTMSQIQTPDSDTACTQSSLGTLSDLTCIAEPDEVDDYDDDSILGEPVIDDTAFASLCAAIGERPEARHHDATSSETPAKAPPQAEPPQTSETKRSPMPTLPERGSIARLGERRLKAVPRRIGKGKLVPARLTWKPGDPFAEPRRTARPRFRWDVMLTAACLTAVCGMGCAWLLRTIFV